MGVNYGWTYLKRTQLLCVICTVCEQTAFVCHGPQLSCVRRLHSSGCTPTLRSGSSLHRRDSGLGISHAGTKLPKDVRSSASGRSQDPLTSDQTPQWKASTVIPYVRGVSESIRRILSPLGIRVCYKPFQTLKQMLSHPKDPVPDLQRRDVVYKIPCAAL